MMKRIDPRRLTPVFLMSGCSSLSLARALRASVAAVILLAALCASPAAARRPDLPLSAYKSEPGVRIGVLLKAASADVTLQGDFTIIDKESDSTLASGSKETFTISLEPPPAPGVPGALYRVTVGSFKSFEDASFAADKLSALNLPVRIAYPDQWYLWYGPFSSTADARSALAQVQAQGYPNSTIAPVPLGKAGFTVRGKRSGMVFTGAGPVVFRSGDGKVTIGDTVYRGDAEALPDSVGTFSIVNLVRAEDYLKGVVPHEMPPGSDPKALKAQAIIARTYLLNNRSRHNEDGFELCSTTDCQVYGGIKKEVASTNAAVEQTRGMVLAFGDNLANALFFSTCGGRTSSYSDIWTGSHPPEYLLSVNDGLETATGSLKSEDDFRAFLNDTSGNCTKSKYYRWEKKVEKSEMQGIFNDTIPKFTNRGGLKIGDLTGITIAERSDSGRVIRIVVSTSTGDYTFERDAIRWVLGNIKSTLFTVDQTQDENGTQYYLFRGAGWGHGVGLCQMGAMKMALGGASYEEILLHYYPGTRLVTIW